MEEKTMKNLANDEILIPPEWFEKRTPTQVLRLRNVGSGRLLLEQWWVSFYKGVDGKWIPVSCSDEVS